MYILFFLNTLFADTIGNEKAGIRKLNHTLNNSNFWVYNQEELLGKTGTQQFYNSNNMFLVLLSHDNKDTTESHKKQLNSIMQLMLLGNMINLCSNSYSYIVFYNEKINIEYFAENANSKIKGAFYYKAVTTGANMFFVDESKKLDNNDLINFYLNNCKFEVK